jgi:pimeloyl-ACP methyl ester carboxylesterase
MVCRVVGAGALFFLTVWAGAVSVLWAGEPYLVFNTGMSRSYTAQPDPAIFESRLFSGGNDASLNALVLKHTGDEDRYWILFCPPAGASTQVRDVQGQLKHLWTLGYDVFAFDYRGFGANPGTPTEQGLYDDATAAYHYVIRTERVPATRVILAGRSLGSAVAVDLATRVPAAGLLLFAPIDSVPAVASRVYPWAPARILARYEFDSFAKASTIDLPVVLFHGWPDSYMRQSDARNLLEQFRGQRLMVKTGGGHHHAGFVDSAALYRSLARFWPPTAVTGVAFPRP